MPTGAERQREERERVAERVYRGRRILHERGGVVGRRGSEARQAGTLQKQMCLGCRQPQTSLTSFASLTARKREAEREWEREGKRGREPQLQLVYSISIINELLGIFVAYAGRDAQPKGETKSTAVAQQFALPALLCAALPALLCPGQLRLWLRTVAAAKT